MRVGTWNLEGRWSAAHATFMEQAECDVWLLSLVPDAFAMATGATARSEPMSDDVAWAAVWSATGLEALDPVHPAVAIGRVGTLLACSCVLPGRGAAPYSDDDGDSLVAITRAALEGIRGALAGDGRDVIWGGGFNHALHGREQIGTLHGRKGVTALIAELGLQTPTSELPHRIAGIFSTDHVAVPERWGISGASRLVAESGGRRLTDADAYVVDCAPALAATHRRF